MAEFAICRTEKLKTWSAVKKSVGHNLRTSNEDRSHLNKTAPEPMRILIGDPSWVDEWHQQVDGMHLRKLQQGQSHTLAREFFLGMSPEIAATKSKKEIDAWAQANVDWLKQRFGKERVKFAVMHLDEQTPHIAAYVVPLTKDTKADRGNGLTLSDRALNLGGNKAALTQLQDEYAKAMEPHQLKRGLRGSKATHQKTSQWRKQMQQPLDKPITKPKPPEPTTRDRIDIKAYGERVAHEAAQQVFNQMLPYHKQAKEQAKELKQLKAMVAQLQPLADMFKGLIEWFTEERVDIGTQHGQKLAATAFKSILEAAKPHKAPRKSAASVQSAEKAIEKRPSMPQTPTPKRKNGPSPRLQ